MLGRRGSKEKLGGLNGRLGKLLITRFGARQGVLALGRAVPFGIGAGIGAAGNAALARAGDPVCTPDVRPAAERLPGRVVDADPAG